LAVGLVLAVVFITGDRTPADDVTLAADNSKPRGAKGLKLLLDELDHDVEVATAVPGGEVDTVVVLQRGLTLAQTRALEEWVDDGGRAVVVGQFGLIAQDGENRQVGPGRIDADVCDIASLVDLSEVSVRVDDDIPSRVRFFDVLAGDQSCVGDGVTAAVVARPTGDGVIVSVGAGEFFTNRSITNSDNAILAVGLMAPMLRSPVVILEPDLGDGGRAGGQLGAGGAGVFDLIPARVYRMFGLFTLAAVIYIASRGRRLGKVVEEPLPANIEGSEFVTALGNLRERSRRPDQSAQILANRLRQDLARMLGLDADLDPQTMAAVAAERTPATAEDLYGVLGPRTIETDAELVSYSAEIERVTRSVRGGLPPSSRAGASAVVSSANNDFGEY